MSKLKTLQAATTLHDVADILGFQPKSLAYILYKKPSALKYKQFDIPKRSGGVRKISAPYADLMNLQRRLSKLLQTCIAEINVARKVQSSLSHGFRPKHSIITNAANHLKRRYVFNTDLENFFGTINFGRVRGFFIKNHNFELTPKVATVLAQIACHDNSLPQGSPCSPVLSNLIGHVLDIRLAALAHETGCRYSRYADDLTFSTSKVAFPADIAVALGEGPHQWQAGKDLAGIISKAGFKINPTKTRPQYAGSRQEVTGLVVNAKVNIRAEYQRTARAMAHRVFKTGKFQINQVTHDDKGKPVVTGTDGTLEQLKGILSFIDSVRAHKHKGKDPKSSAPLDSMGKVYRHFLLYKDFYTAPVPVIVCEGKTDNIYIKAAVRRLAKAYPLLAQTSKSGSVGLKVRIFRFTKTTKRILGLGGGTGELAKFISTYPKDCEGFHGLAKQQPIIVLVDNDAGAKSIYGAISHATGAKLDGSAPFYALGHNLYVVPTPLGKGGKASAIEDFFKSGVKKVKLGGKTFNPSKKGFDNKTEYGKYLFAEQVVKKHESKIDFGDFKKILDRLVAVLGAHAKTVP